MLSKITAQIGNLFHRRKPECHYYRRPWGCQQGRYWSEGSPQSIFLLLGHYWER